MDAGFGETGGQRDDSGAVPVAAAAVAQEDQGRGGGCGAGLGFNSSIRRDPDGGGERGGSGVSADPKGCFRQPTSLISRGMTVTVLDDKTALVLIDLQAGTLAAPTVPYPPADVVGNAARLADAFRAAGAPVVLVRMANSADGADAS